MKKGSELSAGHRQLISVAMTGVPKSPQHIASIKLAQQRTQQARKELNAKLLDFLDRCEQLILLESATMQLIIVELRDLLQRARL